MGTNTPSDAGEPDLQTVLAALDDDDCRAILRALDHPKTAKQLMDDCDLSQTTTYRKLDLLGETALVSEATEIREDGHHTTRYERAVEGVFVGLGSDAIDLRLVAEDDPEPMDETLARLWTEMGEGL
jgi:DNA-binding transcriptional ArsR family regulator